MGILSKSYDDMHNYLNCNKLNHNIINHNIIIRFVLVGGAAAAQGGLY